MASGTPVIASDIKSLKEIISDGRNGLLFKSGDPDDLARAILTLHGDTRLRKKCPKQPWKRLRNIAGMQLQHNMLPCTEALVNELSINHQETHPQ
jgi:glycosyltransferase involved in cell wall biosynthesis